MLFYEQEGDYYTKGGSILNTNLDRIKHDIEKISKYNETPGNGITRFTYSKEDKKVREFFMDEFKKLQLKTKVDGVGNIRARLEGSGGNLPVVMSGSHIDTVLHGGKFDGVVGAVCALEVVRTIVENDIKIKHPIEVVIFAEEEGSNFGSSMAGSKVMVGEYGIDDIKKLKNNEGVSMYEMAKNFGLDPDKIEMDVIKTDEIKAMVELHIEQGEVLDDEKISIGVVDAIAGSKWLKIDLHGVSNHAGATPMHLRQDPLVAAAKIIDQLGAIIRNKGFTTTVGTVGKIECKPNIINSIPERVSITLDIRDVNPKGIDMVVTEVEKLLEEIKTKNKIDFTMEIMGQSDPIILSKSISDLIEQEASKMGIKYKRMNSGAVHDSSLLANITDVGMIFVPSINGRSHVPEEKTEYKDIKRGCDLLLATIVNLAN